MRKLVIGLIVLLSTTALSGARAEKPNLYAMVYLESTVSFTKIGPVGLPLSSTIGLGMLNPIKGRWSWYTELELTTPVTVFNPAPRLIAGPNITLLDDKVYLSIVALYQFTPAYGDVPVNHLVGGGFDLLVAVSKTISFGLVVGGGATLGIDDPAPSLTLAPNVSFQLY